MGMAAVCMTAAIIFVNGATDAPSSVAPAVAGGNLKYANACILCALFNFFGMLLSGMYFPAVAENMSAVAVHGETGAVAAMLSVVVFSVAAWFFGIPTSESHGLLASLGGVALYYTGSTSPLYLELCLKSVLWCTVGFVSGGVTFSIMRRVFRNNSVLHSRPVQMTVSGLLACASSFCHGAQDGQKFIAILASVTPAGEMPWSAYFLSSVLLGLGCLAGGRRIVEKTVNELTGGLDIRGGIASETAALICTAVSSFLGIPVSTTYMKTSGMLGAAAFGAGGANIKCTVQLLVTWLLTYPCCMGISYALCFAMETII